MPSPLSMARGSVNVSHTSQKYLHLKWVPRLRLQSKGVCKGATQDTGTVKWGGEGGGWEKWTGCGAGGSHPGASQITPGNSSPWCLQCFYTRAPWPGLGYSEWRLRFMLYSRRLLQFLGFGPANVWNGAVALSGSPCSVVVTHHKHSLQAREGFTL